jgi:hypothetical protein
VLLVFLSSTFAVAKLLTSLSADTILSSLLATWAVTMVAGVILLRQIPRLFEGRPKQGAI